MCASIKNISSVTIIFHFQANMQPLATWLGVLRKCLAFNLCNCLQAYSYVYCILHSFRCVHRDSQRNQSYEQKICADSQVYPPITGIVHFCKPKKNCCKQPPIGKQKIVWGSCLVSESPLTSKVLLQVLVWKDFMYKQPSAWTLIFGVDFMLSASVLAKLLVGAARYAIS